MEDVRSGRSPFVPLDALHREKLILVLLDMGIEPDDFGMAELDELNLACHRLGPWPDVFRG